MNVCLGGKGADAMAAEDVYSGTGDEVVFSHERHRFGVDSVVGDAAIERMRR